MASYSTWLPRLMREESLLHWHAFFGVFLHNHKAHSAIAMARLGASEERVKQHCNYFNNQGQIIPFSKEPNLTVRTETDSIKSDNIADYLGKDVGFYRILDHFTKLYETKYNKDLKKFVHDELPLVMDGPLGSLFHGIIQVGYGWAGESDQVVLEGLALSYQQYTLVVPSKHPERARDISRFGTGTTDILDIVAEIKKWRKESERKAEPWKNVEVIAKHFGDEFIDYTDRIKLPGFFDPKKEDMSQVVKLGDWILEVSGVLYTLCEKPNDFFLLHGVTGAWSLLQVLDAVDYKSAVIAARGHLIGLLITYARVNAPELNKKPEDYWTGDKIDQAAWDKIIQELMDKDWEYHVVKVIQCLYEAWKKNPNSPYAKHFIAGSRMALDHKSFHYLYSKHDDD